MRKKAMPEFNELDISVLKRDGFNVYEISKVANRTIPTSRRRDYYKMGLMHGHMTLKYGDKTMEVKGSYLFFVNPNIPRTVVHHSVNKKGYACLFTEDYIAGRARTEILQNSPLFNYNSIPAIMLNSQQAALMEGIFQKILSVYNSDYDHKHALIKSCIELILHQALILQPPTNELHHKNAATRITHLFMDLLERQFPIESTHEPLQHRTPQDYATHLSVHVNYLNRAVKEVTGKPTSTHIANRLAAEAKALLLYTDWSVADIAYALGSLTLTISSSLAGRP